MRYSRYCVRHIEGAIAKHDDCRSPIETRLVNWEYVRRVQSRKSEIF